MNRLAAGEDRERPAISAGVYLPPNPPMLDLRAYLALARMGRADCVFVEDHFQEFYPTALWDEGFTWSARRNPSPHAIFEYQTLLGSLAAHAGGMRLGVGVTEPVRRHPVLIAQSMLTLAHLTKRAPILGIGSGERENIEPYGLDGSDPLGRLEEALLIIRQCFAGPGPLQFAGRHFRLDGAMMGLQPPPGRTPEIWVAAHGPRMLRLTGKYGDGWLPHMIGSPEDYAAKLTIVRTAAQQAGRDPDGITASLGAYIAVAPDQRRARAMLDSRLLCLLGLLVPADLWQSVGANHPLGVHFRGFVDFVPERYDRPVLDELLAAVTPEVISQAVICGTTDQVTRRLREFGDAGLRHVVLAPMSSLLTKRDRRYGTWATAMIARSLRTGR